MRIRVIIPALLLFGLSAQSSYGQSYTIQEAIDYGLKENKKMLNADFEIEKANQKVKETRAIGLPQANIEGSFNHFLDIGTTVAPAQAFNPQAGPDDFVELQFGTKYNTSATLTATQLLFDGSFFVALKTTKKYKALSGLQKKKTEQEIKEKVTKAYYTVLVSEESIKTLEELLVTSEKMYDDAKKMFEAGVIEADNADQLNLSVLNTKNAITTTKNQMEVAKTMLKYEMGLPLDTKIELSSNFEEVVSAVSVAGVGESSIQNNVDLELLNAQIELNKLNIKYEQSRSLPSLGAFFSHQQSAFRNDFDFFDRKPWYPTTIWGLQLKIPVFSSGQSIARVRQAKIQVKQNENQYKELEDGLKLQLANAQTTFLNAESSYDVQKQAVTTAKNIYDRHQIKYREGVISSMELTQAQSQYVQAQSQYVQSMYQLINTKLALDKLNNKL